VYYHIPAAPAVGGGLYLTSTARLTATNSIIATNIFHSDKGFHGYDDCAADAANGDLEYSLFTTLDHCNVGGPVHPTLSTGDPLLGPLQDNGGETLTQALTDGSPALDAADPAGCTDETGAALTYDQRGAHRNDARCDMGAYEKVPETDLAVSVRANPGQVWLGVPLTYTIVVTNTGPADATNPDVGGLDLNGMALRSAAASQGTCTLTDNFDCQLGPLAAGGQATISLVITPTASGSLVNEVLVAGSEFDPAQGNNTASATTRVPWGVWLTCVLRLL
jgi:hypothetical protein